MFSAIKTTKIPVFFFISRSIFPTHDAHDMPVTLKNPFFDRSMFIASVVIGINSRGRFGDNDLAGEGVFIGDVAFRAIPLLENATVRSSKEVLERYVSFSFSAKKERKKERKKNTKTEKKILIKKICMYVVLNIISKQNSPIFYVAALQNSIFQKNFKCK